MTEPEQDFATMPEAEVKIARLVAILREAHIEHVRDDALPWWCDECGADPLEVVPDSSN